MPMDAVCLQAVLQELRPVLTGLSIEKISPPARDQLVLQFRFGHRLLLSAGGGASRIQLTRTARDNPAEPPMFCMLLRKHLTGGRITAITQPPMERLAELEVDITDDFGRQGRRWLVLEAMGRSSNIILLDEERRIVDCLRRVDGDLSEARRVLPGLFYEYPPSQGKLLFTEAAEELPALLSTVNPERRLDEFLMDTCSGISPLLAREIACQSCGSSEKRVFELTAAEEEAFFREVNALSERIHTDSFVPTGLYRDGKFADFTCVPIIQYGTAVETRTHESFCAMLDDFYEERERSDRIRQRGQDLVRTATAARDRLRRKLGQLRKDYTETQNRDQLRICGDLITANLWRMERGPASFTTENYYDENKPVTIQLDPLLTPQQNAAKYYKRYAKAKAAESHLREQMDIAERDAAYLDAVLEEIARAETEQDFLDIRAELKETGFLRVKGKEKKELKRPAKPREYRTSGGFRVLAGRNNKQNDQLTRGADYRDLWLHTQKIHGSHVILCTGGADVPEQDLLEAAVLAAWHSQGRESSNVPVDYTPVKYVKKPAGARPGMVIYTTYRTVYVTPEEETVKKLAVK